MLNAQQYLYYTSFRVVWQAGWLLVVFMSEVACIEGFLGG